MPLRGEVSSSRPTRPHERVADSIITPWSVRKGRSVSRIASTIGAEAPRRVAAGWPRVPSSLSARPGDSHRLDPIVEMRTVRWVTVAKLLCHHRFAFPIHADFGEKPMTGPRAFIQTDRRNADHNLIFVDHIVLHDELEPGFPFSRLTTKLIKCGQSADGCGFGCDWGGAEVELKSERQNGNLS